MKRTLSFILFLFIMSYTAKGQYVYSNGLISTGTTTKSGVAAPTSPAQHEWSELQNDTGNTTQTNNYHGFDGYYNGTNTDLRVFDDFTVPFGQTWNISSIDAFCYQLDYLGSTPPIDVLRVRIWSGFPYLVTSTVVAGNMTSNILDTANSQDMYILRISNTQVPSPGVAPTQNRRVWRVRGNLTTTLTAGVYWIEYQGKAVNNAIFKFIPTTTVGSRGSGNANQYNAIANTFSSLSDTGSPLSAPDIQQDLAFNINYTTPLATNEFGLNSKTTLYPNPVSESLFVTIQGIDSFQYQLIDAMGKILRTGEASNKVDISDFQSGVYIIRIKAEGQTVNRKFLKN